jgi:hypothetical protein
MGPGQPGIALGGLFYLLLALLGPVVEVARALRGRSTATSRRLVTRHFALAASMLVALDLTYRGVALLLGSPGGAPAAAGAEAPSEGLIALPTTPLLLGLALLALVLAATRLADLGLRLSSALRRDRRRPIAGRAIEATGD